MMNQQVQTVNRFAALFAMVVVLSACTTAKPYLTAGEQVLDLIKRVMAANESGVLEDRETAFRQLGFSFKDQLGRTPEEVLSGVQMLDRKDDPTRQAEVRFWVGTTKGNIPAYSFRLRQMRDIPCITQFEIEAAFGKPTYFYPPHSGPVHDKSKYVGAYVYERIGVREKKQATFSYMREGGRICLESFGVEQSSRYILNP
jgi:hypothetical protein